MSFRIGFGYDNHRLVAGRPLMLGGYEVPAAVGAEAHSDGDVLLHATVDAILGALGEGDIGTHFPDSDPRWKGKASRVFLEHAAALADERGYRLVNLDTTVILQEIKLAAHKAAIAASIGAILAPWFELAERSISVKAKTNERCDAVGEGRAIAAYAAVLLHQTR